MSNGGVMYCTDCGSKLCKEWGKNCIFSKEALPVIVQMLEAQFFEYSIFNKSYSFVPFDTWDEWADSNNFPTQDELMFLYPEEDLENLLFMVLQDAELSPELRSFYHHPFDAEDIEIQTFSEFSQSWRFDGKSLTLDDIMLYNKKPVKNLPRPDYVELRKELK